MDATVTSCRADRAVNLGRLVADDEGWMSSGHHGLEPLSLLLRCALGELGCSAALARCPLVPIRFHRRIMMPKTRNNLS